MSNPRTAPETNPMSEPLNPLQALIEDLKPDIRDHGRDLAPDADWMPCVFMISAEGSKIAVPIIPSNEPEAPPVGQQIAQAAVHIVKAYKPKCVALLTTAWMVTQREDGVEPSVQSLEHHPRRIEVVTLIGTDRDGNSANLMAEIKRRDSRPPKLRPWMEHDVARTEGRLVEALREGMQS
jgi:hypothetical protein